MRRVCLQCGKEYFGRNDSTLCPDCAAASKAASVVRPRVCRQCGRTFDGGPRAWYCPTCRAERQRERDRKYKRSGPARPLGSTDLCEICGKPYIVTSGRQRYCPDCAEKAVREKDREQSRAWNREHVDIDQQREQRHAAAAPVCCEVCGKIFVPDPAHANAITCSPECAEILRKRRAADWEAQHREQRNAYQLHRTNQKLEAMTPEERRAYQDEVNARARAAYHARQKKK